MTNAEFATMDETFREACELANIPPTRRQAGKFRRETGLAYKALRFAKNNSVGDREDLESRLVFAGLRRS